MNPIAKLAAAAALVSAAFSAQAGNVLVVLSDAHQLELKEGKTFATGFYLNEMMEPVKMLINAGHSVTFATPLGRAPALDQTSIDPVYFGGDGAALTVHRASLDKLAVTLPTASPVISLARAEQVGYAQYDAVYVPGGHAPMQDLIRDPAMGRLLRAFHRANKTTALVCHGPAALVSAADNAGAFVAGLEGGKKAAKPSWIYAGYQMTVFSNVEEEQSKGMLKGGVMKLYPQNALQAAGASYTSGAQPWTAHVVVDRELITGQNPASAREVGTLLLARLKY